MDRESIREQLQRLSEAGDIGAITGVISASFDVATYSLTNRGHAGLDLSYYTHATSPIRRYSDMVNHRLLRILLRGGAIPGEAQKETEEILEAIAQKISVQPKEREKVFIGLTLGREVDAKGFLPPLSEARTANLPPARLAFLLQNCFDDPASMAFFRAYFSDYRENNQYVEILNQFCRLEGWAGPEYTEKEVKPARRSGRIRYTGQFSVVVDGVRRSSGVKPYPMVGKKSARNRAAFYLLKDYVMERLSGPAIKP
jgi:hypothetical protein